jgi:hypothetical protein
MFKLLFLFVKCHYLPIKTTFLLVHLFADEVHIFVGSASPRIVEVARRTAAHLGRLPMLQSLWQVATLVRRDKWEQGTLNSNGL